MGAKAGGRGPTDPDATIHVFVARCLPAFVECANLAARMNETRKAAYAEIGVTPDGRDDELARIGEFPRLADAFDRHGYPAARDAWDKAQSAVAQTSGELALLRPVTLRGFIAKARVAKYDPVLALHIARDLQALDGGAT